MVRPRNRQRCGRGPTQRNRRRRVTRHNRVSRLSIRPTERECRRAGLYVYRSSALQCPSFYLCNNFPAWQKLVASRSVLQFMGEGKELGLYGAHSSWSIGEEMSGRYFEYRFRLRYPIPIHVPPTAMKLIALFSVEYDNEWETSELWEQDRNGVHH